MTAKRAAALVLTLLPLLALLAGVWLWSSQHADAQSRAQVVLQIVDSDGVVAAGTDLDVHVWIRRGAAGSDYTMQYFHAVNGPIVVDPGTRRTEIPEPPGSSGYSYVTTVRLAIPLGSPEREATISAMVHEDDLPLDVGIATFDVGDAGDPIDSAQISTTYLDCDDSGERSSTSLRTRDKAYLELEVENSRGKTTNDHDVSWIFILAYGATITLCDRSASSEHTMRLDDNSAVLTDADAVTTFLLESIDRQPIHVDVHATVVGADGSASSNTLTVNFAGQASRIESLNPTVTLPAADGEVRLVVKGFDSDDNGADIGKGDIAVKVIAAPEDAALDGVRVNRRFLECDEDDDTDCEDGDLVVLLETNSRNPAGLGVHTVEVTLTDIPQPYSTTAEVLVVGEPVVLQVELYRETDPFVKQIFGKRESGLLLYVPGQGTSDQLIIEDGETVYAAAVLRDRFGERIFSTDANIKGDGVEFQVVGSLEVTQFDDEERELVLGVAFARFLFLGGESEGQSLIVAFSGDLEAHATVLPEEEARFGLDGLIKVNANNFSTWIGPNTVRASELAPLLESRGIQLIMLYVGGEQGWLRYASVGGEEAPGSKDFSINYGDTLWLGG